MQEKSERKIHATGIRKLVQRRCHRIVSFPWRSYCRCRPEKCASDGCVFPGPPLLPDCRKIKTREQSAKRPDDRNKYLAIKTVLAEGSTFFLRFRLKDSKRINCIYDSTVLPRALLSEKCLSYHIFFYSKLCPEVVDN